MYLAVAMGWASAMPRRRRPGRVAGGRGLASAPRARECARMETVAGLTATFTDITGGSAQAQKAAIGLFLADSIKDGFGPDYQAELTFFQVIAHGAPCSA